MDDASAVPLPTSPYTHATKDSLSTASLVSVRLSDRLSQPPMQHELLDEDALSDVTIPSVRHSRTDSSSSSTHRRSLHLDTELGSSLESSLHTIKPDLEQSFRSSVSTAHLSVSTVQADDLLADMDSLRRARSDSVSSAESEDSEPVDWKELDKTELSEPRNEESDESTAFLLARLEQENNALAADQKFEGMRRKKSQKQPRPPSIHVLKQLVSGPGSPAMRYSALPDPPPMTELEFWAALVKDYKQTAQRLPTLTTNKIKAGVPPPLRGVVWMSMVGARDSNLSALFAKLVQETSPYETIIGKDIGRSFPGVDMFKDVGGEGQLMLGRVLKAFSLYDKEIGYCQGMGFLVGPLLMQMGDCDAFCVLVKLMDNFDLRTCFQPDLSGLHLRTFQFQRLLELDMPKLAEHLKALQLEAAYLSQWFLSFFAVTCPLPMLFRIYDVIFAEGASETIMRVALSLMKRNEQRLLEATEFEDAMQLLLGRALWDVYGTDADELVNDFMAMTGLVTRDSLTRLESAFKNAQAGGASPARFGLGEVSSAATGFLGRLWTTKPAASSSLSPGNGIASHSPNSMKRVASKQSIASTINSTEHTSGDSGSIGTTLTSRESSADALSIRSKTESVRHPSRSRESTRELHSQIEELLTALTVSQKQTADLAEALQREREARNEEQHLLMELVDRVKSSPDTVSRDKRCTLGSVPMLSAPSQALSDHLRDIVERVDQRLAEHKDFRCAVTTEHRQRLRDSLVRSKDQLGTEMARATDLARKLDLKEKETLGVRDELREARARIHEGFLERQRLERTVAELKRQSWTSSDGPSPTSPWRMDGDHARMSMSSLPSPNGSATASGLRELKLGRRESMRPGASPLGTSSYHPPRGSSLATKQILSTQDQKPAREEQILLELVQAKTAEASAKQELEELKSRFEGMRKMLNMSTKAPSPLAASSSASSSGFGSMLASAGGYFTSSHKPTTSEATITVPAGPAAAVVERPVEKPAEKLVEKSAVTPGGGIGGAFWSWGKRSVSSSSATAGADGATDGSTTTGAQPAA